MFNKTKKITYNTLLYLEKWTKTDMVYLTRGGFWLTLGQGISSLSSLLLSIVFANLLPRETYGIYKYVLSVVAILAIPTLGGMNTAIIQAIARGFEGSFLKAIKLKIYWGTLGSLAGLILSGYYFLNSNNDLAITFIIASIFLPIMEAASLYDSLLQGKKDFRKSSLYFIISQIFSIAILVITILLTEKIYIIVLSYFISWTITRSVFLIILLRNKQLNKKFDNSTISYGKHLSIMNIIMTLANYLDRLLVFHFLGAVQLAIYSIAIAPPEQIKSLIKNIATLAFPKMASKTKEEISSSLKTKMYQLFGVCLLLVIIYILLAPQIFSILFPSYKESIFLSQLFALSLVFSISILPLTALQSQKKEIALYKFNIYTAIAQIVLLVIFVYFWGIIGIILARILTRLIVLIYSMSLFNRDN